VIAGPSVQPEAGQRNLGRDAPELSDPLPRRAVTTGGVFLVSFLGSLESTVVSTAMPTVVADIGGMAAYAWIFTAYMAPLTVTGPLWGKLSDLYGRRRMYLMSVSVFVLGSALAGMSPSMNWMIGARIFQGIGAGGLAPLGQATLADLYGPKERAKLQAWFMLVYVVASAAGPSVGGAIAEHWNWRFVFYLNLPFGLIGASLLVVGAFRPPAEDKSPRIDWMGAALFCIAFTVLLLVVDTVGKHPGHWLSSSAGLMVFVIVFGAFLFWEIRSRDALIPMELFRQRTFSAAITLVAIGGGLLFSAIVYLPLFFQTVFDLDPTASGRALTPLMIGWMTTSAFTARLALRIGYRTCSGVGVFLFAVGYGGLFLSTSATPVWLVSGLGGVLGLGAGFIMIPLLLGIQHSAPRAMMGAVTSFVVFSRNMGAALGIALVGMGVSAVEGSGATGALLENPAMQAAIERSLHAAFGVALIVSLLSAIPVLFITLRASTTESRT